jgi:hypothetical protein
MKSVDMRQEQLKAAGDLSRAVFFIPGPEQEGHES